MKKISELILYKDHHIMVFNKPAGIATQDDKSGDPSMHRLAMAYAHRDLYVVHRLDRRVGGVLLLAKTKTAAAHLSNQWKTQKVKKVYLGIVPAIDIPTQGSLKHYLTYDNKKNITEAHDQMVDHADEAELHYQVLQSLENYMILRIDLISGRKHQIRAQLAAMGMPIRGDIKYGAKRTNADGGIDLHACALYFHHPVNLKQQRIVAPIPTTGLWEHIDPTIIDQV